MKRFLSLLLATLFALTAFGVTTVFSGFITAGALYDYYVYTQLPGYSIYSDAELAKMFTYYFSAGHNETIEGVGDVVTWPVIKANSWHELYPYQARNLLAGNHTNNTQSNYELPTWAAKDTVGNKTFVGEKSFEGQDGIAFCVYVNGQPFTGKVSITLLHLPCRGPYFNGALDSDDGDHDAAGLNEGGTGFRYSSQSYNPDENGYVHYEFKTDFYQSDWWSTDDDGVKREGDLYNGGIKNWWPVPEKAIAQINGLSFSFSGLAVGDNVSIGDMMMWRDSRVHLDELEELMMQFDELDPEAYTESSYSAATECYLVAYEVMTDPEVGEHYSQKEINGFAKELKNALKALQPMFKVRSSTVTFNGFDVLTDDDIETIIDGGASYDVAMLTEDVIPDSGVNQSICIIGNAYDGEPSYGWSLFTTSIINDDDEVEAVGNVFGAENADESAGLRFWIKYEDSYLPRPQDMIIGVGDSANGVYFECDPEDITLPADEGYVGVAWNAFYDIEGDEEIYDYINSLDYFTIRIEGCYQKEFYISDLQAFDWDINSAQFADMDKQIVDAQAYMLTLNKDDWSVRSWQRVFEAIDAARALHDTYAVTQAEVDKAADHISRCLNWLTPRGETPTQEEIDALEAAFYNAQTYWHGNYTGRTAAELKAVLDYVGEYIDDELNTTACRDFLNDINTAVSGLVPITSSTVVAPTEATDSKGNAVTVKLFSIEDFKSGRAMSKANGHRVPNVGYDYVKPNNVKILALPADALRMTAQAELSSKPTDQHGAMQFKLFDDFGNPVVLDASGNQILDNDVTKNDDGNKIGGAIGDLTGSSGIRVWVGVNDVTLAKDAYFRFGVSNCQEGPLFERHAVNIPFPASGSGWLYIPWESFDFYDDWTHGVELNLAEIRFWIIRVDGVIPEGLEVYTTCISAYTDQVNSVNATPVISGVTEGQTVDVEGGSLIPKWDVGAATLNGRRYISGTPITMNDDYVLTVTNGDKQTSVNFTVTGGTAADTVPIVTGVEEGGVYEEAVTINWDVGEATLNGDPFENGGVVEAPGAYLLQIINGTKSTAIRFTISSGAVIEDEEPVVSGVADGEEYEGAVSAAWTPETATATLNGEEYAAGTEISEAGEYVLVVTNGTKSVTVSFTIKKAVPPVKKGDADGDGMITVADALAALRIAARLAESTPEMVAVCDTDGDGSITVADALAILRVAAKLADESSLG